MDLAVGRAARGVKGRAEIGGILRGGVAGGEQGREEAVEEEAAAAADGWHDQAPPISPAPHPADSGRPRPCARSEEHTSELQSLMRISYAVFCLKKKNTND